MKKLSKRTLAVALFSLLIFFFSNPAQAQLTQVFSESTEMVKTDVKGRYFGTFVSDDGSSTVFYASEKGGFNGYNFDSNGKFSSVSSGGDADAKYATLQDAQYSMDDYNDMPVYKGDMIVGSATWTGKLKVLRGPLYLDADEKFIHGPGFDEEESFKPEIEGTWNTRRIGYRSYAPDPKVRLQAYGKQASFEFKQSGPIVFAPETGSIQAAGVVVEKVVMKNIPETSQNRIVVFSIPGSDPNNIKNSMVTMPYALQEIGTGITAKNDFAVMVMPLHAATTYKPHKKLIAPEGKRNRLYVARFDQENNLRDTVSIPSTAMFVDFQYVNDGENDFIIGMGNEKDKKWHFNYIGAELNRIQFIKLGDDGKVIFHKTYNEEEIASKLSMPGAKKNSHNMKFTNDPIFEHFEKLPNGNHFMYGEEGEYGHAMLISPSGELIHYYLFPHTDLSKNIKWNQEFHTRGNDVYLAIIDQPAEFTNEVVTTTSYSQYAEITTTKQKFEIFHVTQLFKVDGESGQVDQNILGDAGKEWYTCGNTPVMFLEDAMYVTGRAKGPKGKEIFVSKYSY